MSPLNRGPLLGPRLPPVGIRPPPPPRFGGRLPPPGLPPRMPPPPMSPVFGPMRQRLPPPPRLGGVTRPAGPMPLFGPRVRGMAPMVPPMGLRAAGPRGPPMRPWPRRGMPPQIMSHIRPRFAIGNGNIKGKAISNVKKVSKLEELELKKPWMTDEIRTEIQKKNKLYAKAKKNKDAKEWEEFKDLRNKVTRMIRDAKNDYLAKHPEQGGQKTDDKNTVESEGVQKTENATEQSEQTEQTEETQPTSEQAHLYPDDEKPYDQRDENYVSSEDEVSYYCEVCDRDFTSEENLVKHKQQHKLCGIDGCTFSAHLLLVERHISMQHSTGLYHRMKNLSTPEDIEKWLMERKKKYPTKANIELRKAEELEKVQRGEIIQQKQEVVNLKTQRVSNLRNKRRKVQRRPMKPLQNVLPEIDVYRGVHAFPGTLNLPQIDDSQPETSNEVAVEKSEEIVNQISDEEELPTASLVFVNTNSQMPSLVANYGTDSEDDPPDDVPIKKIKVEDDITNERVTKNQSNINVVPKSDIKESTSLQTPKSVAPTNAQANVQVKQEKGLSKNSKDRVQPAPTNRKKRNRLQLLNRLLSRSIQHERNLICQCVKYIIDNNFFE